jgi:hypothetical protein
MTTKKWKLFEEKSKEYLNKELKDKSITVVLEGGSNSRMPDLVLFDKFQKKIFSIEAKLSPSQGGQIVIINDGNKFNESEKSKNFNEYSQQIIEIINSKFLFFVSKESKNYELTQQEFNMLTCWVKRHYFNKDCKYIITSTKLDSFYAIIPLAEIDKYFEIKAVIRQKKSGTTDIPLKDKENVKNEIISHYGPNSKFFNEGKKLILEINDEKVFSLYFGSYFLSRVENNRYRIVKRSKTNNLNIVFTLKYKGPKTNFGLNYLIQGLG